MFGAIYIARNSIDEDEVYKVGKTQRTVDERMKELTSETSNLGQYEAVGSVVVNDIDQSEKECHLRLKKYRIQPNREFFKIPLSILVDVIRAATEPYLVKDELPETTRTSDKVQMDDIFKEEQSKYKDGKQQTDVCRENVSRQLTLWHKSLISNLGELKDRFYDNPYMDIQIDRTFTGIDWDYEIMNQTFKKKGKYCVGTIVLKGKLIESPLKIYLNDTEETPDLDDGRYVTFEVFIDCDTKIVNEMERDFKPKIILDATALCILGGKRLAYEEYLKKTALFNNHETVNETIIRLVAANTCEVPQIKTTLLGDWMITVDDNRRDFKIRLEPMEPFVNHSD
jgi:hypothetical protein